MSTAPQIRSRAPRPVKLVSTGGTIATRTDLETGRSSPTLGGEALLAAAERRPAGAVDVEDWAASPSWAFGPVEMQKLALRVRYLARQADWAGVVVTHGTSTMEYTAFLTDLFLDADAPVVFTGAMQPADAASSDGPGNLADALVVAGHPQARGMGAVICLGGRILAARDAYKLHRTDPEAFEGLAGSLASVAGEQVELWRRPFRPRSFRGDIDTSVALVKAYPGAGPGPLEAEVASGARGLVLEALPGVGGVPVGMQPAVRGAVQNGVLVVVASRSPSGSVPSPPTGGTGEPLREMDLLSAGDLTAEKAWVLLMVVLGEATSGEEAKRLFEEAAAPSGESGA